MKHTKTIFLFALILLSSCSKDDNEEMEKQGSIGSISEAEFNASIPPTYEDFSRAFQSVTDNNDIPSANTDKLSQLLFEEIKENGSRNGSVTGKDTETFFNTNSFMNKTEWRLVLTNPIEAFTGIQMIKLSYDTTLEFFPCDEDVAFVGTKANAFKQAFWSALMVKNTSLDFANKFSIAKEAIIENQELKNINLYNNDFGIKLASKFPEATNNQLFEILVQENYFTVQNGSNIDSDLNGLAYINGIREFDRTMTGSFGNPDSGDPWDITINFSQCWNVVRGRFTIVRDEALQERRFAGIFEDNVMRLNVSDPYIFENPEGLQACVEIIMMLEGDETGLTGSWVSPNCPQGGLVVLENL